MYYQITFTYYFVQSSPYVSILRCDERSAHSTSAGDTFEILLSKYK